MLKTDLSNVKTIWKVNATGEEKKLKPLERGKNFVKTNKFYSLKNNNKRDYKNIISQQVYITLKSVYNKISSGCCDQTMSVVGM